MTDPVRRVPPPTRLPALLTTPLSWAYALGIGYRNRAFDAGRGVTRLDRPVISVGNLSTGGTGKTPTVHLIVRQLRAMGHEPVIAMRGYRAEPGRKGDEQLEHESALPGVPIVAQPDRLGGLRALFKSERGRVVDCVVLDDGFQHRRIARDLDIVLIDATRPPDRDALLPRGHLREPIRSLRRADLVLLTHAERVDASELERLVALVGEHAPGVPVMPARHVWGSCASWTYTETGWSSERIDPGALCGRRVHAVSGIGNPDAFLAMAEHHGLVVEGHERLSDHAPIGSSHARVWSEAQLSRGAPVLLMTRKDWVKASVASGWACGVRVIVPELRVEPSDPGLLREMILSVYQHDRKLVH